MEITIDHLRILVGTFHVTSPDVSMLVELASGIAKKLKLKIFLNLFLDHHIAKTRAGKSKRKPAPAFF